MTLIKLLVSKNSEKILRDYLLSEGICPKEHFHSTIIYSEETPVFETPFLRRKIESNLPISINPETYKFKKYGPGNLALSYSSCIVNEIYNLLLKESANHLISAYDKLRNKNEMLPKKYISILKKHNERVRISPIYPDFNPHITLSKEIPKKFPEHAPEFSVCLDKLDWNESF